MSKFRKFARLTSTYSMTPSEQILWQRIKRFEIDDPSSEFTFTDRLARENGWSLGYAIRAVYEYKKFIFLVCTTAHPLTPSDAVDQVWHLHLLYTDSYWIEWCRRTLERDIKHGPTKGGKAEKEKFHDCYALTQQRYRALFETEPPPDIWPSSAVRFGEINFVRVNTHRHWIIPKPKFIKKWKF